MSNFKMSELTQIAGVVEAVMRPAPMSELASKVAGIVDIASSYCETLHRLEMPGAGWHVKESSAGVFHIVVKGTNTDRLAFLLSKRNAGDFARAILKEIGE